tara:strand:- start:49 stop:501 length:453 start_codon:yes stop_codon:yes gene_type:complete
MFFKGPNIKNIFILLLLSFSYSISLTPNEETEADSQFRSNIMNLGKSNRTILNDDNIRFEDNKVVIEAHCRRNNIQSTLVKTYWMCGYTLNGINQNYSEVFVILHVSGRNNILVSSANGFDVKNFGNQESLDYEQNKNFLNKLNIYSQKN